MQGILAPNRVHYWDFGYFDSIDTEQKAYWYGYCHGDGSDYFQDVYVRSKFTSYDPGVIAGFVHDIKYTAYDGGREIIFFGIDFLAIGPKHSRVFPPIARPLVRHFLRGLFDADGSISFGYDHLGVSTFNTTVCHASFGLLDVVARELGSRVIPGHGTNQISINGRGRIQDLGNYLYRDATRYMERKIVRFREAWDNPHGRRIRSFRPCRLPQLPGM